MKHSKRRRLTSEDFNKALGTSSTEVKLKLLVVTFHLYNSIQRGVNIVLVTCTFIIQTGGSGAGVCACLLHAPLISGEGGGRGKGS